MNLAELRREVLAHTGSDREARLILEESTGRRYPHLLIGLEDELAPTIVDRAIDQAKRRVSGEPLQHIVGSWPFRELELSVGPAALIPRPETEEVVGVALELLDETLSPRHRRLRVLDLGTGTGAIALSIAYERAWTEVVAVDLSGAALELAAANLRSLDEDVRARIELRAGDWYEAVRDDEFGTFDLVISNPPYLSTSEMADAAPSVRDFEPRIALEAGPLGTEAIERVIDGAPRALVAGGHLVVEIGWKQGGSAVALARRAGSETARTVSDLGGRERALIAGF